MIKTTKQNRTYLVQFSEEKEKPNKEEFEEVVIEAIDHSLASFTKLDKEIIYLYIEANFKIRKQEIPSKIENFTDAIEQMFGDGAKLIEIRIIQALHNRIPEFMFFPKKGSIEFKEYIASLRSFLLQNFRR
jgi:hypothetical protein